MAHAQPDIGGNILVFRTRGDAGANLTMRDRMEIATWQESARNFGYDRLVIHERLPGDAPEVGSFLSVYRCGEAWSRWGVTRMEGGIMAWCCASGATIGRFATVDDALMAILPQTPAGKQAVWPAPFSAVSSPRQQVG